MYRSLKPLATSSLRCVTGPDYELVGYELVGPLEAGMLARLTKLADAITKPAGAELVAKAAHKCLLVTKSRDHSAEDVRLMVTVFAGDLAEFPADAVETAFRKWSRREKWWPSLSEIREECHRQMRWRRSLKIALEDARRIPGGDAA